MSNPSSLVLPPYKGSIVRVSALDDGRIALPAKFLIQPPMFGHDILDIPAFCFLGENDQAGKKVMFDLGIVKAWSTKIGPTRESVRGEEHCSCLFSSLSSIKAIIWSHHHIDHRGDPSLFPSTTSLVVGPNFKSNPAIYPGYPNNPGSVTNQDAFNGREVIELDFSDSQPTVGNLRAVDCFQDGFFYILEASGHTHDHKMALARTSEDKFLLLGADAAHHRGEFRPTPLIPLPDSITPTPFEHPNSISVCAGAAFEPIDRSSSSGAARTTPFYETSPIMMTDPNACQETLEALKVFDASPDVLVIIAHDYTVLDFFELS
ncbi:hypothetical protein F5148DRAFT_987866 [Russula earlei]|uniref:Uncharacterized protein n=1 Tax=Russula earlei TaxID=71964 RepID=A0ACC0TVQ8_9AGAM|nr:hypothetical protein F5148DRAFT_987866 [Russula earlei]